MYFINKIKLEWSIDDVLFIAKNNDLEITHQQAEQVLLSILEGHDAEAGVTWETLERQTLLAISGELPEYLLPKDMKLLAAVKDVMDNFDTNGSSSAAVEFIINEGVDAGYLHCPSETQVEWTPRGADYAKCLEVQK